MYTVSRKMGRKRQKLRSDADDRASVYAGYQRRGKNYCGDHFIRCGSDPDPCSDSYSTADRNVDYSTDRRKWIAAINGIIIMHYILDTRVKRSETTCACTLVVE